MRCAAAPLVGDMPVRPSWRSRRWWGSSLPASAGWCVAVTSRSLHRRARCCRYSRRQRRLRRRRRGFWSCAVKVAPFTTRSFAAPTDRGWATPTSVRGPPPGPGDRTRVGAGLVGTRRRRPARGRPRGRPSAHVGRHRRPARPARADPVPAQPREATVTRSRNWLLAAIAVIVVLAVAGSLVTSTGRVARAARGGVAPVLVSGLVCPSVAGGPGGRTTDMTVAPAGSGPLPVAAYTPVFGASRARPAVPVPRKPAVVLRKSSPDAAVAVAAPR